MSSRMKQIQLKSLVEAGRYRPEPALVAEAMLQRRAVRELLISWPSPLSAADQTHRTPASDRRVA